MKKLIGIGMGVAMMALAAVPAIAANNVTIGTTGPGSINSVFLNNRRSVKVNNFNAAFVVNNQTSTTGTGGNIISGNTNVTGGTGAGNATSNTTVDNQINGSITAINDCGCVPGDTNVTVNTTGPGSTNNVTVDNSNKVKVNNIQLAVVFNRVSSTTTTGGNSITNNTIAGGGGSSGNASSETRVTNWLNTSSTYINAVPTP